MKKLSCQQINGYQCPFVADGESDEEARQKLREHTTQAHAGEKDKESAMTEDEREKKMKKAQQWW